MNQKDSICYKKGYLKRENELDNKWKRSFVKLTFSDQNDGLLTLYEKEEDETSIESIPLKGMSVSNAHEMIMLSNINTAVFFCAMNEKEALEWKVAIMDAIEGVIRKRENQHLNLFGYTNHFDDEEELKIYQPLVNILKISLLDRVKELNELITTSRNDLHTRMSTVGYRKSGIRSIYWKLFLDCIPEDQEPEQWTVVLNQKRNEYAILKKKYLPSSPDSPSTMTEEEQEAYQVKQDFIITDINRTRSSDPFFKDKEVQSLMLRVLMIFAQEFPTISYKQGMSDFLAIILLLIFMERYQWDLEEIPESSTHGLYSSSYLCTKDMKYLDYLLGFPRENLIIRSEIQEIKDHKLDHLLPFFEDLCNPLYIEHDCYIFLNSIMSRMLIYYTPEAALYSSSDRMERKLSNIQNSLLCSVDKEITDYLNRMEIDPSMYLLRWLRLLFCREFQIDGVFYVWDAIISDTPDDFDLSDFIAVAILVRIKETIVTQDDMQGLLQALKPFLYFNDAEAIIQMARKIRSQTGFYNIIGNDSKKDYEEEDADLLPKVWNSPPPQRTWTRLSDTRGLKPLSTQSNFLNRKARHSTDLASGILDSPSTLVDTYAMRSQYISFSRSQNFRTPTVGPPQPQNEYNSPPPTLTLPSQMFVPTTLSYSPNSNNSEQQ